jgi:glycine cleavage system H protein
VSQIPDTLRYTAEHEWITTGDPATIGITATASEALGDIVFLELPEVGAALTAGAVCGEIESTKSVSELYSPVTGTVVEVNAAAVADPSIVNADPFGAGWLFKASVESVGALLSPEEYEALAAG